MQRGGSYRPARLLRGGRAVHQCPSVLVRVGVLGRQSIKCAVTKLPRKDQKANASVCCGGGCPCFAHPPRAHPSRAHPPRALGRKCFVSKHVYLEVLEKDAFWVNVCSGKQDVCCVYEPRGDVCDAIYVYLDAIKGEGEGVSTYATPTYATPSMSICFVAMHRLTQVSSLTLLSCPCPGGGRSTASNASPCQVLLPCPCCCMCARLTPHHGSIACAHSHALQVCIVY